MQECIMRYDQANFYERALGSVQWKKGNALVRGEPYGPPEAPGTEFCDDPKGTGVNAVGRPGGPKAGNASLGKCKEQFLVNDTKH